MESHNLYILQNITHITNLNKCDTFKWAFYYAKEIYIYILSKYSFYSKENSKEKVRRQN